MTTRAASPTVLMLLRDPFINDSRVLKEAVSLVRGGFRVRVVALAEADLARRETVQGVEVVRVASRPVNWLMSRLGWRRGRPAGVGDGARAGTRRPRLAWAYLAASVIDGSMFALRALLESLRFGRPGVVHAHNLNVLPGAWLIARLARAPLVYDSHEVHQYSVSMRKRPRLWRAACRRAEAFFLRRAEVAITANDWYARAIAHVHHVPPPIPLYNAPRLAESGAQAGISLRAAAGSPPQRSIAAYSGRIQPSRGIEEAIEALALVADVDLVLLGAGEPAYIEILCRLAERHGVAGRLKLVPPVQPAQVSATLRGADVGLVLIQDDGLSYRLSAPNKLFEAVHAGLPVIASDFPEMRAVLSRFACGLVVDEASPPSIAAALRAILGDAAGRRRMSEGASAAARELNWENEERKLLAAYRRLH